ncbi:uncharacterized protein LOC141607529 [Silene latifolia]|uniref:uncharacterized protein LOC141607529 n=1 Tax=Silene latifolia TaxID=37657 RepID=UPI003D772A01
MLSQALVKGYSRKNISPRCLIKVDIRKAFDSLQWSFLSNTLLLLGFPPKFRGWIMSCISSPWFSLKINGELTGFFQGRSGIRQGDPLSPYLFVLGMGILSRYLRRICDQTQVSYHPKCSNIKLTHLIFADDLMIFIRGDVPSVSAISDTLHKFALLSGLHANTEKTNIYFGGVSEPVKELILSSTGFSEGAFPFRYLGLPLHTSRLTSDMFDTIIIKIQQAMAHWSNCFLPYAGKLQLINSIVFGLKNFWCSTVLIPRTVIAHINKLCKDFFWGIPMGSRKMVFKSWHQISSPWSSASDQGLWSRWVQKYILKHEDIWHISSKVHYPSSFKSILAARDRLVELSGSISSAHHLIQGWLSGSKLPLQQVYGFFRNAPAAGSWTKGILHSRIIPSHRIVCSLAVQNQLATIDNLKLRGMQFVNRCSLCEHEEESQGHLFFSCSFSASVWHQVLAWMGHMRSGVSLKDELTFPIKGARNWQKAWFDVSLTTSVHQIWTERNARIFQGHSRPVIGLVRRIKFFVIVRMLMWKHHSQYRLLEETLCN